MTKAEKDMGIIKPKYRISPARPTPGVPNPPRRVKGRFGYTSVHQIGRRVSSYTRWFTTEAARDQSYATVLKNDSLRSYFVSCDKVNR